MKIDPYEVPDAYALARAVMVRALPDRGTYEELKRAVLEFLEPPRHFSPMEFFPIVSDYFKLLELVKSKPVASGGLGLFPTQAGRCRNTRTGSYAHYTGTGRTAKPLCGHYAVSYSNTATQYSGKLAS